MAAHHSHTTDPTVSHGRGDVGNVHPDGTPYSDGEINRQGRTGDQGDEAYSSGCGGAGNIDETLKPESGAGTPHDTNVVPQSALRRLEDTYHTGRGGSGNAHKEEPAPTVHKGFAYVLMDKMEEMLSFLNMDLPSRG